MASAVVGFHHELSMWARGGDLSHLPREIDAVGSVLRLRGCSGRVRPGQAVTHTRAGPGWSDGGASLVPLWSTFWQNPYLAVFLRFWCENVFTARL